VRQERLKCPEILFQPHLQPNLGVQDGIHKQTFDSIMKCDVDIRRDLFRNIVLAGGCTMFKKIRDRMHKEIQALAASPNNPHVSSPADRKHSCWLGGAILSSMEKFQSLYITKADYADEGRSIVHKKCF
jgi:actin, other eukaryote